MYSLSKHIMPRVPQPKKAQYIINVLAKLVKCHQQAISDSTSSFNLTDIDMTFKFIYNKIATGVLTLEK